MTTKGWVRVGRFDSKKLISAEVRRQIDSVLWVIQKALKNGWRRRGPGELLRFAPPAGASSGGVVCFCPVTLYCLLKTGVPFSEGSVDAAANLAGLSDEMRKFIVNAADSYLHDLLECEEFGEASLRQALWAVTRA